MTRKHFLSLLSTVPLLRYPVALREQADLIRFEQPWTSPFRVDPVYPFHFVNGEGHHLYLLNKTAWAFFGCSDPRGVLDRARHQGITTLRVALEGTPYFKELGIDMWPWGGSRQNPDFSRFDPVYWQRVEERLRMAGEAGIGLDVVLYFTLRPTRSDIAAQQTYWQLALDRLGRYANLFTWEIANEYVENESFQDAAGAFFRENDPWQRPVITSDGTTDDAVWPHKPWMSMALVHTCTGSTPRHDLQEWYQRVAWNTRAHGKPAFNNESGREVRHKNDDPVHRRKQSWIWNMAGAYWTWHSWEGCEGIDDAAYRGPGAEYLRPLADFFQRIPFWQLDPNHTALFLDRKDLVQGMLAEPDRSLVVCYLCTKETSATASAGPIHYRLPDGVYDVSMFSPGDMKPLDRIEIQSRGLGTPGEAALPAFTDDLLLVVERRQNRSRTRIDGTG